jgi:uncharacterized membrane protein
MVAMVPQSVPNPEFMVTFTGICEIPGAIGLLVPRPRRLAAVALIMFMVAACDRATVSFTSRPKRAVRGPLDNE